MYAKRLEDDHIARRHLTRVASARSTLYDRKLENAEFSRSDSKSAWPETSPSEHRYAQLQLSLELDESQEKYKIQHTPLFNRQIVAAPLASERAPSRGSPAYFAGRPLTSSHPFRPNSPASTTRTSRLQTLMAHRPGFQFKHTKAAAQDGPQIEQESLPPNSVSAELLQTILGTRSAKSNKGVVTSGECIPRPSDRVPPPSTLFQQRRFRVATPASIEPLPLPHVAVRLQQGIPYEQPVDKVPNLVKGSYSDLVEPESVLAAPPANFAPLSVLDRLSRPSSRVSSPSTAPQTFNEIMKKGESLFGETSRPRMSSTGTQRPQEDFKLVTNASFWDELDRFSLVGAEAKHNKEKEQLTPLMNTATEPAQHQPNVGSHRSGSAARSLITPLVYRSRKHVQPQPQRQISHTYIGVGVELPTGDAMAMRAVTSAQQRLEASFKASPGQHSAGDFFVIGPQGSSACPTIPATSSARKDGLLFNKFPTEQGPVLAPLTKGQSAPSSPGSFHSPLNALSLRQRETATKIILAEANVSPSASVVFQTTQIKGRGSMQTEQKTRTSSSEWAVVAESVPISPRRRSARDASMRTGVGSTRGGTSVASPISRLAGYGRRNSSSALGTLVQGEVDDAIGVWTTGKTKAEISDGYENAASNGFYAGLRRAGSFFADEVDALVDE